MGSGKTYVGEQLAGVLDYHFIDFDSHIEEKESNSIPEIFKEKGEIYFRKKESQYLRELLSGSIDKIVLSLGGGTPCYSGNMDFVNSLGLVKSIYLKCSIANLTDRLFYEKDKRPLITHLKTKEELTEFIGKHIFERNPFYNKAEITIHADSKSAKEIIESIVMNLY